MKLFVRMLFLPAILGSVLAEEVPSGPRDPEIVQPVESDDTFKIFPDPTGKEYFPKGMASYYTRYLSAMKEPSVKADLEKGVQRVFRFTYLPSFADPITVRIVDTGDALTARAVRLKNDKVERPVRIVDDRTWQLGEGDKKTLQALWQQKDFWKPLNDVEEKWESGKLDGSQWIFEIHDKDGYRMIDMFSPSALARLPKGVGELGIDPTKIRDFLVYDKTGEKVFEIGKVRP